MEITITHFELFRTLRNTLPTAARDVTQGIVIHDAIATVIGVRANVRPYDNLTISGSEYIDMVAEVEKTWQR